MGQATHAQRNATDAHVNSGKPSTNYADSKQLLLQTGVATAFLHFNRPFPLGATIVSATLRLYAKGSWGISPTLSVRRVTDRWAVSKINDSNRPTVSPVVATKTQSSAADGDEWAFNVAAALQDVSNGAVWFGFRIETDNANAKYLYSSDAVDFQPILEVTYSEAPQAPTTLSPSGSRAVSIAKPVLTFDFTDTSGSTDLQSVQVQVDAGGNFTTPAFDSGTVATTVPELDLATTAYAGLSAGVETRWRVRVQDAAGLWSPWSDVERWRRDLKGTLTITSPAASPNNKVAEWTPPLSWTLTGETQKAWRLLLVLDDDPTVEVHDTGWTQGTATSYTLPKAVIEDDEFYRMVLRIRDSKDREHTDGDPVYTEATRTFQFAEDPTPNPVTGLTAGTLLPRPWVQLDWSRSTMPDSFSVVEVVDGKNKVYDSDLDPTALLVSGTSYRYVVKDSRPNRSHTWKVQAVVNGKASASNPTVTKKTDIRGLWLVDRDRDIEVYLASPGRDLGEWAMAEDSAVLAPLGSERSVVVTQGLRGYENAVRGMLMDNEAGKTLEQWEDALLRIRSRPGQILTLSAGDESIRGVAYNISISPTPNTPTEKAVTFNFNQRTAGHTVRL